jgi:uncharacterized protein (TIGR00251 family)
MPSTRLRLRVSPGSRHDEIVGPYGDGWKVRVSAVPERGKANEAVLRLLSDRLAVPVTELAVVAGRASRDKVVELRGLSFEEASARLGG